MEAIIVTRYEDGFVAAFNGDEDMETYGATFWEAVGRTLAEVA